MGAVQQRDRVLLEGEDGTRLMQLCSLDVDHASMNFVEARRELEAHIRHSSDGFSQLWGYIPDLAPDPSMYPQCRRLAQDLDQRALRQASGSIPAPTFRLAFLRLAIGRPQPAIAGVHVDVHDGVDHHWPANIPPEWHVIRLLINLAETPRRLEYCPLTVDTLRERYGLAISRQHHELLDLPKHIPLTYVEIPPISDGTIWCLRFVSSLLPHVGHTDDRGHFLASFGGYLAPGLLPTIWR